MACPVDIDEEELKTRAVQAISTGEVNPPPAPQPAPKGISSGASSIKKIDVDPVVLTHRHGPVLEKPQPHYMYNVLEVQHQMEKSTARSSEFFSEETKRELAEMHRLSKKKQQALKEQAKAAANRDTWERFSNIGQYIAGAGTIALGFALSGIPAYLLIAGGAVGIGKRAIKDTNLLQSAVSWHTKSEELQKRLTQQIEMSFFFLQMGFGLAGVYTAWTTGALAARNLCALDVVQKLPAAVSNASLAITASQKVALNIYNKQLKDHSALTTELNGLLTAGSHQISRDTGEMTRRLQEEELIVEGLVKAVKNSQISLNLD